MHEPSLPSAPCFSDVLDAADRIAGVANQTPLLNFKVLDEEVGGRVFLKAESLQRTGSFKFRGAFNRLSMISPEKKALGVVACSSGNHAQGIALAARLLGVSAKIVVPADAPEVKKRRTAADGAEIILYDRENEDREEIAEALCKESGATFVHPYNDPGVISGQGTSALEATDQLAKLGLTADNYLVCTGGGGLTAGSAIAIQAKSPATNFFTVEPEGFDDHARSFVSGRREKNAQAGGSICDALMAPTPGSLSFPINQSVVEEGLVVSEQDAMQAVAFAFRELKLVVEPGGAVALAALLSGKIDAKGQTSTAVLSGGNIDAETMMKCLDTCT
ncbi:MAG: threonine/serine dehydratase [Stappiaceae bacterium]